MGTDQNFDLLKYNTHTHTQILLDTFISHGFNSTTTKPTRITHSTATLIDNIYTKPNHNPQHSAIITTDISDHLPIIYTCNTKVKRKPRTNIKKRPLLKDNHIAQIASNWQSIDRSFLTISEIDIAFASFYKRLIAALDKHAPVTEQKHANINITHG
jgi:hypothetical protein